MKDFPLFWHGSRFNIGKRSLDQTKRVPMQDISNNMIIIDGSRSGGHHLGSYIYMIRGIHLSAIFWIWIPLRCVRWCCPSVAQSQPIQKLLCFAQTMGQLCGAQCNKKVAQSKKTRLKTSAKCRQNTPQTHNKKISCRFAQRRISQSEWRHFQGITRDLWSLSKIWVLLQLIWWMAQEKRAEKDSWTKIPSDGLLVRKWL